MTQIPDFVQNTIELNLIKIIEQQLKLKIGFFLKHIESSALKKIKDTIDKVAPTDARVLVTGENGSGKELVARWMHEKSNRSSSHSFYNQHRVQPGNSLRQL